VESRSLMTSEEPRDLPGKSDRSRVNNNTKRVGKSRHVNGGMFTTVTHLFPSSSLPCTRRDDARDAGFFAPPTTASLTTRVDTHTARENELRSLIESCFH